MELGSGPASELLALDYEVCSVEHDKKYVGMIDTVEYIYAPIVDGWYDLESVPEYDLLLVDGPPGRIGRSGILDNLYLFDLSKPVIVDDTHRKEEQKIAHVISDRKDSGVMTLNDQHKKKFTVI